MFRTRRRLSLSFEVLKSFQVSSEPKTQLVRTARGIASALQADVCLVFVKGWEMEGFQHRAAAGPGAAGSVEYDQQLEKKLQEMAGTGSVHHWFQGKGDDPPVSPGMAGGLRSALVVPVMWHDRAVAVFVAGFTRRNHYLSGKSQELNNLSESLAPLLRGILSRVYQTRKNELAGELIRVSENLGTMGDVKNCIAGIAKAGADLTGSSGSVLRMEEDGALKVKAFYSSAMPGIRSIETPNDLPYAEKAFTSGRTVVNNGLDPNHDKGTPVNRNLMCVPFSNGNSRGVLTLFDRGSGDSPSPFTRLEREITRSLLRVGMMSLSHIGSESDVRKISRSLELRVRELTLLHQISRAAIDQSDLNVVLRSLLEAVTNVEGYGFNRAFLFMHDHEDGALKGAFGVEALPVSGTGRETAGSGPQRAVSHRGIDDLVTGLTIQVRPDTGILSKAVLERRSFRIRIPRDRDLLGRDVVRHLGNVQSFAVSPLLSDDNVFGVIWADNFRTVRPVRLEDFRLLVTAAAQAALAIERSARVEALDLLNSQLHDLQNQLIQWEKMAALGEMAASVAHDIRNPLVSIGGFTRRLEKLLPDDNKGRKYAEIIIQEVDRLEWTLDNVMSYARRYGMIDRKPVKLYGLLSECAELFRENFKKKRITLKSQFERGIPEVMLDERQIKQALINILFNAGESVPGNSEVSLSASLREKDGDDYIVIEVADNGEGIDPQVIDRVFTPFFTTKATGTGLGLAIALRAVSGHGGEIQVDNRYGEGVTFSIYLPAARVTGS
jgi:signal transduction histidine kinase